MALGLTSCDRTADKIIGTWEAISVEVLEGDGETEILGTVWEFNSDKTCTITDGHGLTQEGTYRVKGDILTMHFDVDAEGMLVDVDFDVDVIEVTNSSMTIEGMMKMGVQGTILDSVRLRVTFRKR